MNKNILKAIIPALLFAIRVAAQEPCATDPIHAALMNTSESYRNGMNALEEQVRLIISNQNPSDNRAVYTIPVVVHVIHLGEPVGMGSNISDLQIQEAIDGMNDRWRNFIGNGIDMEVQFCLAPVDPDSNASTGINRVDGSSITNYISMGANTGNASSGGADEQDIKDLSRWPVADYYNIWVVNAICGGWAGWAYYPNGNPYDGTTIRSDYMVAASSILAHELGHGFFLYHTFEGDGGNSFCPQDANCASQGDRICDTQPHMQGDCASSTCTGSGTFDNSRYNYMSYCSGLNRFTPDQKARVQAILSSPPRASLLLNTSCESVGIEKHAGGNIISVYPNPANNQITIYNLQFTMKSIEVSDLLGNKHISLLSAQPQPENNEERTLDISSLAPGVYFVHVTDEKRNKSVRKFVKM
jgi:hypothetical protein